MKNFLQYLGENQKIYEFRIKVANCDPADKLDGLKIGLAGYEVESLGAIKHLPIKANDIDFPSIQNCEIFLMDASLKYPVNDAQLRAIVAERLGCPQSQVVVVAKNNPEEIWRWNIDGQSELREFKKGEDVLTQPLPEASEDQKAASKFYSDAGTILKELEKPAKFEIDGTDKTIGGAKDPAYGKTTNDVAQGQVSPVGSKQNKIPTANKGRA
jgi:hypothetical protein